MYVWRVCGFVGALCDVDRVLSTQNRQVGGDSPSWSEAFDPACYHHRGSFKFFSTNIYGACDRKEGKHHSNQQPQSLATRTIAETLGHYYFMQEKESSAEFATRLVVMENK